jgi:hypothetical protein
VSVSVPVVSAPVCPTHGQPMHQGQFGWYCRSFVGVGLPGANRKGYCTQEVRTAPRQAPPVAAQVAPGAPIAAQPDPRVARGPSLAAACLAFAGQVFQGTGAPGDALQLARDAYAAFRGELT